MKQTMFNPDKTLREIIARKTNGGERWLQGISMIHAPRHSTVSRVMPEFFSSAGDLARYAEMILNEGKYGDRVILKPETVRAMLKPETVPIMSKTTKSRTATRTLGWDHQTPYSSNRGTKLSHRAIAMAVSPHDILDRPREATLVILSQQSFAPRWQWQRQRARRQLTDDIVTALEPEMKTTAE